MTTTELMQARDTAGVKMIELFAWMKKNGDFRDGPISEYDALAKMHAMVCAQLESEKLVRRIDQLEGIISQARAELVRVSACVVVSGDDMDGIADILEGADVKGGGM